MRLNLGGGALSKGEFCPSDQKDGGAHTHAEALQKTEVQKGHSCMYKYMEPEQFAFNMPEIVQVHANKHAGHAGINK